MNTWIRRTLQVGLISAGFVIVGAAAAQAATVNHGLLNGNDVLVPVQLPVNVCGNAVGVLGHASAGCEGGATARNTHAGGGSTGNTWNHGVLNGNTIAAPIQAPVNVSGNAIGVLGHADAASMGGATARLESAGAPSGGTHRAVNHGIGNGNGNLIYVPVQAPINVCGNAVAVLGHAEASCQGGATARNTASAHGAGMGHTLNSGIGNGNAVLAPVQLPINVCGNSVAAAWSKSAAACEGGALAKFGPHTPTRAEMSKLTRSLHNAGAQGGHTTINHGIGNGNLINVPVQAPINVCGNAVAVFGKAEAACEGGATARNTRAAGAMADKVINHGVLNGNRVKVPVQVPVNVAGNALAVFGNAAAYASGGSTAQLL